MYDLNELGYMLTYIGNLGGVFYFLERSYKIHKIWSNRSRFHLHRVGDFTNKKNGKWIIDVELENLGNEAQSLKPIVKYTGIDPILRKQVHLEGKIIEEGEGRVLISNTAKKIYIVFPDAALALLWFGEITLETTKSGLIKIRRCYIDKNWFHSRYLFFTFSKYFFIWWKWVSKRCLESSK